MIGYPLTRSAGIGFMGSGDSLLGFNPSTAQLLRVVAGTLAAPDTTANPLAKFERTVSLLGGQVSGDGVDLASTLQGLSLVPVGGQVQGVGVFGTGKTLGGADVCGLYGLGQSAVSGHVGIGLQATGWANAAGAQASGAQIASFNSSGADGAVVANGFSSPNGIWLTAVGGNKSAVAVEVGNPGNVKFRAAFHVNGQNGGAADLFSFVDDGSAATGIQINGTHATAAIAVAGGAGATLLQAVGFYGHAAPAQPAAPVTLADVIAIIRGCGLSA